MVGAGDRLRRRAEASVRAVIPRDDSYKAPSRPGCTAIDVTLDALKEPFMASQIQGRHLRLWGSRRSRRQSQNTKVSGLVLRTIVAHSLHRAVGTKKQGQRPLAPISNADPKTRLNGLAPFLVRNLSRP